MSRFRYYPDIRMEVEYSLAFKQEIPMIQDPG